ncbi:MAG: hypothetical protein K6D38_05980 [Pseudobutyrivibrio sp.]|nr:hypothetical protein [Pseudobutyrivibrio sp.]
MKKQIIAATLMASMVLAVGYSNGTNVKVTTHEGKVVEAKASPGVKYMSNHIVDTGDALDELCQSFYNVDILRNSLGEVVFNCTNPKGQVQVQVKGYDRGDGNFEMTSYSVYGTDMQACNSIRIGDSISRVKSEMKYPLITESKDYLEYDNDEYTIAFIFSNGVLLQVAYFYK